MKRRLLTELKNLSPVQFEHFCSVLLQQLGFQTLTVTRRSGDGGIDGHGDFRQGAVSLKSAFQAKRWTDNAVGRPEIDRFRGAIQGEFDHGVFITTSRFARQAVEASYRKGAITILLLDGEAIVEQMVERGIGVTRQPVYLHEIDPTFFSFDEIETVSCTERRHQDPMTLETSMMSLRIVVVVLFTFVGLHAQVVTDMNADAIRRE